MNRDAHARSALRSTLGEAKTILYRKPRDKILQLFRQGPRAYFGIGAWMKAMETAARALPNIASTAGSPLPVTFMTGQKHWFQTAFCAWTLGTTASRPLDLTLLDDGSLDKEHVAYFQEIFGKVRVDRVSAADARISDLLPASRFPCLHEWRKRQILFRKLTDVHAGSDDWKLFLDSDMLFFSPPSEMLNWWAKPDCCIFQTDCIESYGYSREFTESLTGYPLLDSVNIGIFSLKGSSVDWLRVEHWLARMEAAEGHKYNVTQCITTMLISGLEHSRLDADRYLVAAAPGRPPAGAARVLEHYVSDAKPWYFEHAWRYALHLFPESVQL